MNRNATRRKAKSFVFWHGNSRDDQHGVVCDEKVAYRHRNWSNFNTTFTTSFLFSLRLSSGDSEWSRSTNGVNSSREENVTATKCKGGPCESCIFFSFYPLRASIFLPRYSQSTHAASMQKVWKQATQPSQNAIGVMVRTKINSFVLIFELLAAGGLASHRRRECILLVGFHVMKFLYTIRNPNEVKLGTH